MADIRSLPDVFLELHPRHISKICKLCGGDSPFFDLVDFLRICDGRENPAPYVFGIVGIPVYYYRCGRCDFLFTDHFDNWSVEDFSKYIYNKDYVKVDPEYVTVRPLQEAAAVSRILSGLETARILDYGSGNGAYLEALRTCGFINVVGYDPIVNPSRPAGKYDVITCFEVVEHSPDPVRTFENIFSLMAPGGFVLMSQALQPKNIEEIRCNWWYIGPRNGHVSTYSEFTLLGIAAAHEMELFRCDDFIGISKTGADLLSKLNARLVRIENVIYLHPSGENRSCWNDIETNEFGPFSWTRSSEIRWNKRVVNGINRIILPFVNKISDEFVNESKLFINGAQIDIKIETDKMVGTVIADKMEQVTIHLVTPSLISPATRGISDSRSLGIAVSLQPGS
jgi:SAM-dependent methyltransferase